MTFDSIQRFFSRLMIRRGKHGFETSSDYWLNRYARGANSGAGSYNQLATFKAEVINDLVQAQGIRSIIEFGCGDGNQLRLAEYPAYLGFDISRDAIRTCRTLFAHDRTKRFLLQKKYKDQQADLTLSLDVLYHLVEDKVFEDYMRRLFAAATKFVVVYSSDTDDNHGHDAPHVRHRRFSNWIAANATNWRLLAHIPNRYPYDEGAVATTSFADFFIYARKP